MCMISILLLSSFHKLEPRQDLINFDLITDFLNNRRNLLTIDQTMKQFNTGLFCVKTITLINYITPFLISNAHFTGQKNKKISKVNSRNFALR